MQSILQHSDFTEFKICCCKYIKTCHGTLMVFIFLHPLEDPFCPLPLLKWSGIKMQSPTARLFFNCISCDCLGQMFHNDCCVWSLPLQKKLYKISFRLIWAVKKNRSTSASWFSGCLIRGELDGNIYFRGFDYMRPEFSKYCLHTQMLHGVCVFCLQEWSLFAVI